MFTLKKYVIVKILGLVAVPASVFFLIWIAGKIGIALGY